MSSKIRTAIIVSLTCLAAGLISLAAIATDGKSYNATHCQYFTPGDDPDSMANRKDVGYSRFGKIVNKGDRPLTVICPIVRDSQRHSIEQLNIVAICPTDSSACISGINCRFRTLSPIGEEASAKNFQLKRGTTGPNDDGIRMLGTLFNQSVSHNTDNFFSTGRTLSFTCTLPTGASLSSYHVEEAN